MDVETLGKIAAYATVPIAFMLWRKMMLGIFAIIESLERKAALRAQRRVALAARSRVAKRCS